MLTAVRSDADLFGEWSLSSLDRLLQAELDRRGWSPAEAQRQIAQRNKGRNDVAKLPKSALSRLLTPLAAGEVRPVSDRTIRALSFGLGLDPWQLKQAALRDEGWQTFTGDPGESFAALAGAEDLTEEQREELRVRMREIWQEVVERPQTGD